MCPVRRLQTAYHLHQIQSRLEATCLDEHRELARKIIAAVLVFLAKGRKHSGKAGAVVGLEVLYESVLQDMIL